MNVLVALKEQLIKIIVYLKFMKRLFYLIALLPFMVACTNEKEDENFVFNGGENNNQTVVVKPSTKVFAQGAFLNYSSSTRRDFGYGTEWPKINTEEGWEAAKFSIRIDGCFPGVPNQDVAKYWSKKGGPNLGKVYTAFPWATYDDRGLDYTLVDTKTGNNVGMFRYVLDPFGTEVNKALMEVPDMKVYFQWLMAQDDVEYKTQLAQALADWDDYQIIWYVAKEVGMKQGWHVNGYLKKKSYEQDDFWNKIKDETDGMTVTEPKDAPNNVEIDIHQQEHKDWNEIKTSIHIRTDVQHVQVKIPIKFDNIVEADDFAIRIFNYYISGVEIKNMITHDDNGITIDITNIDPAVIEKLKAKFGDGLTIEVHSYCKKDEDGEIWKALKNVIITTGTDCSITYHISSAYQPEEKWINYTYVAP